MKRRLSKKMKNAVLLDARKGMRNREIIAKHGISVTTLKRWKQSQLELPKQTKSNTLALELRDLNLENRKLRDLLVSLMLQLASTHPKHTNGFLNSIIRQVQ